MRSICSLAAAAAAVLLAIPAASAADLPMMPPPQPAPIDVSGWYLRGYVGVSSQKVDSLTNVVSPGTTVTTTYLDFDSSPFFGLGVGYQLNNWLRFDFTGEYRSKTNFKGAQTATALPIVLPDQYIATKREALFMANAYLDLGTWWCLTPFIGAGIGTSYNTISNFTDTGATQVGGITILSTTYGAEASKWNFAWAAYAGVAYRVTPAFTVDLSYRYLSLGNATTGPTNSFDGVTIVNGSPFQFHDLTSQDIMLGVRWTCCDEPPPPPPLMRKG